MQITLLDGLDQHCFFANQLQVRSVLSLEACILDSNASSSESSLHLRLIVLWHLTAQLCKRTATVHVHDGVHSMKGGL